MATQFHVLVVDDEIAETIVSAIRIDAEKANIQFDIAKDGGACISKVEQSVPDLILLDMQLPVLDGLAVMSQLQAKGIRTRIIMMSGVKTDITTAIQAVKAGACDYIVKGSIPPLLLLERIRRALIVDSTINSRISDLPPSTRTVIEEASRLKADYERLSEENERFRQERDTGGLRLLWETTQKVTYVAIAAACVITLRHFSIVNHTAGILISFLLLVIFLFLPSGRIKTITATLPKVGKGHIELEPGNAKDDTQASKKK